MRHRPQGPAILLRSKGVAFDEPNQRRALCDVRERPRPEIKLEIAYGPNDPHTLTVF